MKTKIIIPFRDRGLDPRRGANLEIVMAWWYAHGYEPQVVSDGLGETEQFNRHRAYNRAVDRFPETDVFIFTEADMLIHPSQINAAVQMAAEEQGLVVPFTQYRYLSDAMTSYVRDQYHDHDSKSVAEWWMLTADNLLSIFNIHPESTMEGGKSIGAVNVVSRETLHRTGGFTEKTSGNWYDDNIIEEGFAFLTGSKTRWVDGPAVHMYHLPGHKGTHLSEADRNATMRNLAILRQMRRAIQFGQKIEVQNLMAVRTTP